MTSQRYPVRNGRGFSLVEILVVIGIIAVLLAILLPVIGRSRRAAVTTACLSNTRELLNGYTIYLADKKHRNPNYVFTAGQTHWFVEFRATMSLVDRAYTCPAVGNATAVDYGGATQAWTMSLHNDDGVPIVMNGCYGFNAWWLQWDPIGQGGDEYSGGPAERHLKLGSAESSLIPVFADSTWSDAWPRANDRTPPNLITGDHDHQGMGRAPAENMMARFTIARRGKAINVSFIDGHAETIPLDRLKRLKWHEGFVYQDWGPALPAQ